MYIQPPENWRSIDIPKTIKSLEPCMKLHVIVTGFAHSIRPSVTEPVMSLSASYHFCILVLGLSK